MAHLQFKLAIFWESESCSVVSDTLWPYTVNGTLQARILEWVAFPFSRGSSQPRDWTKVSCIADRCFTLWVTREAQEYWVSSLSLLLGNFLIQELIRIKWSCIAGGFFTSWATREAPSYGIPHNKINSRWIKESHLGKPNEDIGEYLISGCGKSF